MAKAHSPNLVLPEPGVGGIDTPELLDELQELFGNEFLQWLLEDSPEGGTRRADFASPLSGGFDTASRPKVHTDDAGDRPYLYGRRNEQGGFDFGGGMVNRQENGDRGHLDKWDGHVGTWETDRGAQRWGFSGGGSGFGGGSEGGGWSFGGDVGSGGLQAWGGEDGFELSGKANAVEGYVEGGSAERDDDGSVKAGLSEGWGYGVRGHWGDADRDGHREYGWGFDAGPVSVDVKSEWGSKAREVDRDLDENYLPLLELWGGGGDEADEIEAPAPAPEAPLPAGGERIRGWE